MILGFKQQHNGVATFFKERIIDRIKIHTIRKGDRWKAGNQIHMATGVRTKHYNQFNKNIEGLSKCKSVQSIQIIRVDDLPRRFFSGEVYEIDYYSESLNEHFTLPFKVQIDGRFLTISEIVTLALLDGFDNADEFFEWFRYRDFSGQLIHWTDKKY